MPLVANNPNGPYGPQQGQQQQSWPAQTWNSLWQPGGMFHGLSAPQQTGGGNQAIANWANNPPGALENFATNAFPPTPMIKYGINAYNHGADAFGRSPDYQYPVTPGPQGGPPQADQPTSAQMYQNQQLGAPSESDMAWNRGESNRFAGQGAGPRAQSNGGGDTTTTGGNPLDPYMQSLINAQLQATQYQQEQMDLANRRFAFEQQAAAQAAAAQKQQQEQGAVDSWNRETTGYMDTHPMTGASFAMGYNAPFGQAGSVRRQTGPLLDSYWKDNNIAPPGQGAGLPIGYQGAQSVGGGVGGGVGGVHLTQAGSPGQMTMGTTGINLPDFMYGNRTAAGTPVPLGPQQEAAMAGNKANTNAFNDYAGNYAGFDPATLLSPGASTNNPLKAPTTYPGQGI